MKAFVPYNAKEIPIRKLCRKLQDIGTVNCSFEQFIEIYNKWHHAIAELKKKYTEERTNG